MLREESFGALYPEVVKELDPSSNAGLDAFKVKPGSNKRVVWKCLRKPEHLWSTTIAHRTNSGAGCPQCSNKPSPLAELRPELSEEWDFELNQKGCDKIYHSTKGKFWWRCKSDKTHTWQATIGTRLKGLGNCPVCKPRAKHSEPLPTLSRGAPELLEEWNYEANSALDPESLTLGSSQVASWRCRANPAHVWDAPINERARKKRGCPKCTNRWVSSKERSLLVKFPLIANEWHPTRNGDLTPADVSFGSKKSVWWKCSKGHEWEKSVTGRTQRNSICPECKRTIDGAENTLKSRFPRIAAQWHPTKNGGLTPADVTAKSGRKVWWVCEAFPGHEWETQIKNRTILNTGCPICSRVKSSIKVKGEKFEPDYKSSEPFKTLLISLSQILELTHNTQLSPEHEQTLYRMSFAAVIASLETYLSDLFISCIRGEPLFLKRVLTTDPEFKGKRYSIDEVVQFSEKFEESVIKTLEGFIWHNLDRAKKKFKSVLEIEFDELTLPKVMRAVSVRHDIVHRNGRDKGGRIIRLSIDDIDTVMRDVAMLVDSIEKQISKS
ncbi:MAG: zinc-ribbon domain-containing protein [Verrucomicrobiales bacterium]|nr:zinc-ribbon domain-containing protein [Verrucomicrobiales bacterium]